MVSRAGQLVVRYTGDTKPLQKSSGKVGGILKGVGKVALVAGAAMAAGAVVAGKALFDAGEKAGTSNARIQQIFKSMDQFGKASDKVAGRVVNLSDKLARQTGIDQNLVKEGAAVLSTFSNIAGSADKVGGTFDKTLGLAADLSASGFGSVQSASTMLGKALQDPTKGLTALGKVGVSFTEKEKEKIKAMQEAGDVAGAQKIVLKAVEGQVGGVAKATANASDQIKVSWSQVIEKVALKLVPVFKLLTDFVLNKVIPVFERRVVPALTRLGDWITSVGVPALMRLKDGFVKHVLPVLKALGGFIVGTVVPGLVNLVKWMAKNRETLTAVAIGLGAALLAWKAYVFFTVTVPAIIKAITLAQKGLNTAMKANVIGIVITAIVALVAGLVWFFTKTKVGKKAWKSFTEFLVVAWEAVKSGLSAAWKWIQEKVFRPIGKGIKLVGLGFKLYGRAIRIAFNAVRDSLGAAWKWIQDKVFTPVKRGVQLVGLGFKLYGRVIRAAWSRVGDGLRAVWGWIKKHVFSPVVDFITKRIPDGFKNGVDKVRKFWDGLKSVAKVPVKFLVNTVWNNGLRKMLNAIPGVNIDPIKLGFAKGGAIRGPGTGTSDSIAMWGSDGEHMWTKKEVQAAGGHGAMYAMRKAVLKGNLNGDPKFANGGAIDAAAIGRAQKFAASQAGKPYGWGDVGPSAYDCSGFMSAITNVLEDKYPHSRRGSTANFPWSGFKQGPGQFTISSTPNFGLSGIGHMAGTLAGTNVESRGGRGVLVGPGAMGALSGGFSQMAHLGAGGKTAMSQGGWFSTIADVLDTLRKLPGQVTEMMAQGGWMTSFLKKMSAGLWSNIAGFINKKVPGSPIPATFDNGGTLGTGLNLVNNATGAPERLVRADRARREEPVQRITLDGELGDAIVKIIRRKVKSGGGSVQLVLGRG
jgi:hypothetical protein